MGEWGLKFYSILLFHPVTTQEAWIRLHLILIHLDFLDQNCYKKGISGLKQKKRTAPWNLAYMNYSRYQISA